jgi:hypothetical protein
MKGGARKVSRYLSVTYGKTEHFVLVNTFNLKKNNSQSHWTLSGRSEVQVKLLLW